MKKTQDSVTFDHSRYNERLQKHVRERGWVDFEGLQRDEAQLDRYIAAGITVYEALKAYQAYQPLMESGIQVRVIDRYSIKPVDVSTLRQTAEETWIVITVEDHFPEGGLGETPRMAIESLRTPVRSLAVTKRPHSGFTAELLEEQNIAASAIIEEVKNSMLQGARSEASRCRGSSRSH